MATSASDVLAPVVTALDADGYVAAIDERPDVVSFVITASADVCADCLSPRAVLQTIISDRLRAAGFSQRLELFYPGDER